MAAALDVCRLEMVVGLDFVQHALPNQVNYVMRPGYYCRPWGTVGVEGSIESHARLLTPGQRG